jgi:hypothetical protein
MIQFKLVNSKNVSSMDFNGQNEELDVSWISNLTVPTCEYYKL